MVGVDNPLHDWILEYFLYIQGIEIVEALDHGSRQSWAIGRVVFDGASKEMYGIVDKIRSSPKKIVSNLAKCLDKDIGYLFWIFFDPCKSFICRNILAL